MCGEWIWRRLYAGLLGRSRREGVVFSGAVALDGDCSLGPRSTEDGVHADVSRVLNLGWTWSSEGKLDAKRGQIADWGRMLIES